MLSNDAKTLRNRVKNGKPSSAEADRLMARAAKLQTFIQSHRVPASASAWAAAASHMEIVSAAYGRTRLRHDRTAVVKRM